MMWDRRLRINAAVFYMDYTDLQVAQTNAACLCNLTDNAASAEIKGVEAEFELAPVEGLRLGLAGSYVDAKYKDFLESAIDPGTGQRLDSSDNTLQRTPDTQPAGIDYRIGMVDFNVNYSRRATCSGPPTTSQRNLRAGLVDGRIAVGPEDRRGPWPCGARTADELYRVNIIPFFGDEVSQFGPPRTYGIDLTLRY